MTEPELKNYFTALAAATESVLPPGPSQSGTCLFVLLVVDESNIAQYVSNARREDTIKFLRETAARLEQREDLTR
jgi:hypothetical protein